MDTLVSMGIVAACGWSVYAMFFLDRSRTGVSGLQQVLHASGGIYLEVAASVTMFLLAGRLYEAKAQASKAGIQRLADRICAVFVPCVLAFAAATLAGCWRAAHRSTRSAPASPC
jgi:cation-transporting P-type ATPase A/B/Cu+-exporting ATPase